MNAEWKNLIDELINTGYLKTPRIIEAFKKIDRKDFVTPEYESEAYGNYPLLIGDGQTISQPLTVAFMFELLDPRPGEKILDIGHGSGWTTALLAHIVSQEDARQKTKVKSKGMVIAVERIPELCEFGKKNIAKYGFIEKGIVKTICGDATYSIPEDAPFDKIIAAAAALKDLPKAWREELKVGGVIVAPIGGSIWRFTKKSETEWQEEEFPGFAFVPLIRDERASPSLQNKLGGPLISKGLAEIKSDAKPPSKKKRSGPLLPLVIFIASVFFSYVVYATVAPLGLRAQKVEVMIAEGYGAKKIGEALKEKNVVRSKWLFLFWTLISGRTKELKHGVYQFEYQISIPKIVERLAKGERFLNETVVVIPEGWNLDSIGEYLESEGIVSKEQFFAVAGQPRLISRGNEVQRKLAGRFTFLKERPQDSSLEGYLFPDTYRIFRNTSAEEVVIKMLANFEKKITQETIAEVKERNKTLFEIVTMASLIEKEVVTQEDRALVSGILWKRNELGIGLQVDATVTYLTGKKTTRIFLDELEIDSPYNTYKYRGLPLGPIANPGLSAIRAATFPKPSPYLYYLSTPEGKTIFSETLDEHNIAKAKYLK